MSYKIGPPVEVKVVDENKGEVEAVFSTLNVKDKDGDVTLPSAFGTQEVLISQYNHASWQPGHLPIGKGTISEQNDEAILRSQFFMDTMMGKETFTVIKHLKDKMEWSYGYDILDRSEGKWPDNEKGEDVQFLKKLKVHECSPVILGAGENTRTLSAKSADNKGAIPYQQTGTTNVNWDVGLMMRRITASQANLRAMCAWVDNGGDAAVKGSYKFGHHMVSDSGAVGAANIRACTAGIAVLNGGRGGANIPDSDRQGVYTHLAHHVRDAGSEPPPLKHRVELESDMKLLDEIAVVSYDLDEVVTRLADVVTQRTQDGKQLSESTQDAAKWLLSTQERLREVLTIAPRKIDPNHELLVNAIFNHSRALLALTRGEDS